MELDPLVRLAAADGEHLLALIDGDHATAVAAHELARDSARPAGDVENGLLGPCVDPRDEKGAPPRILAEREEARVALVRLGKRREEGERVAVPLGERVGHRAIVAPMSLEEEIAATRAAAVRHAEVGEEVVGVVPAEPGGARVYVCAYSRDGESAWLALDERGRPVTDRGVVRDAVSIAAMCELAEESAGGGDLGDLRARLLELRLTEAPEGIEEAEAAAADLAATIATPPRVASIAYLDAIGRASGRLEQALGAVGGSPFAEAMKSGLAATDELAASVERAYKAPFT
jgi:hypothetical protein